MLGERLAAAWKEWLNGAELGWLDVAGLEAAAAWQTAGPRSRLVWLLLSCSLCCCCPPLWLSPVQDGVEEFNTLDRNLAAYVHVIGKVRQQLAGPGHSRACTPQHSTAQHHVTAQHSTALFVKPYTTSQT